SDGASAVELALRRKPQVVIMDVRMPGMDGLEATRQLTEQLPEAKVLIFTAYSERSLLGRGFESGAKGYVLKEAPHGTLVRAIEKVAAGDGYVDPALMPQFLAGRDQSDMLTAREREILQLLADGLSNADAAERLFISQPTLSKQIRMLERQLGAPLFDRGRDGVRLTPVGEALLPYARQVLAIWDRGRAAAERAKRRQRATLVAGMIISPGRGLQPAIRSRFAALRPEATVRLRQVKYHDPTAGLADGTADVAFVWLPLPEPDRYRWIVLAEEECLIAMADSHPLTSRDVIDVADLLDEPILALPPSAGPLRDFGLLLDYRGGQPPRVGAEIASPQETYEALADGQGICLIVAGNAPLISLGGVTTRPVRGVASARLALDR
ncbi:MAG: LysR substrate-binding domain-containing protein, partial [Solirubrobacteraceae bacterium]